MRRQVRAARDALAKGGGDGLGTNGSGGNGRPPRDWLRVLPLRDRGPRRGPRLKKLRLLIVFLGLSLLAFVSFIFGIMMAVASDLPRLENREQYLASENSVVTDRFNEPLTTLTGNEARILVESADISPTMKQAVVAIEDQRFYEHRGIDVLGVARAVVRDVIARDAVQGASTITQQFVKNALEAQQSRTIFQKLRESALAYHLEREWSKDKILTQYLNSIYFGEGAYGVEAAAKTYFGEEHPGCGGEGNRCASQLLPHEAALLAGIISSPEAYSPRANPDSALDRRNLVLQKMLEQGAITQDQYEDELSGIEAPLPEPNEIKPPREKSEAPYFTSWLRQQVVDNYGAGAAFGGGLHIKSTLDLQLQREVEDAVAGHLGGIEPTASVVVIDNETGGVLAMVGGDDYRKSPFNLATNGQRQPGSAMKPFTLATALGQGVSTSNVYSSEEKEFPFKVRQAKNGKVVKDVFSVSNYEDTYYGSSTLWDATLNSDNSIYAEVGLGVGVENIAATAKAMGVQTDLSTEDEYAVNGGSFEPYPPALTLGGLEVGVTPLEMSHAYTTLANDGQRVSGTLASSKGGPLGIISVKDGPPDEEGTDFVETAEGEDGANEVVSQRAIDPEVAGTVKEVLEENVEGGTGVRAAYGGPAWGKTGTTENNGDAWFCGGAKKVTACVWVGHAKGNTPMETEYGGAPVDGGTFPALIWADVMSAYEALADARRTNKRADDVEVAPEATTPVAPTTTAPAAPAVPVEPAPEPVPEEPVEEEAPTPAAPTEPAGPAGGGAPSAGAVEG